MFFATCRGRTVLHGNEIIKGVTLVFKINRTGFGSELSLGVFRSSRTGPVLSTHPNIYFVGSYLFAAIAPFLFHMDGSWLKLVIVSFLALAHF